MGRACAPESGKATAYLVLRRERNGYAWQAVGHSYTRECFLEKQERGKEFEYCVVASNRAGESFSSNTVVVVL